MTDQKLTVDETIDLAKEALVENKFKRATRVLEAALENFPENIEILYMLAVATAAQANKVFYPIRSAISIYQNMGIAVPDDKLNQYNEALQTYILQNYRAITYLDKVIEIDKNNSRAFAQRAILKHAAQAEPAGVIADCEVALNLNTDIVHVHYIRGAVYYSQGKYEEAITDFRAYLVKEKEEFYIIQAADALKQAQRALGRVKTVQIEQIRKPWWKFW